jgi:hypothetical protein
MDFSSRCNAWVFLLVYTKMLLQLSSFEFFIRSFEEEDGCTPSF